MSNPALLLCLLLTGIVPLQADERTRLATARDGGDHREEAFAALVENVERWTAEVGDEPVRLRPDLAAMSADPVAYRGDLCRVSGVIQQQSELPRPHAGVREWFLRDDAGRPLIVYVVGPDGTDTRAFRDGTPVALPARFYKRITLAARDGVTRDYPAFVGGRPRVVAGSAATGNPWAVIAVVGILLAVFLVMLVWTRRTRSASARASRRPLSDPPVDDTAPLPDDPAEALAELRRRAGEPPAS